MPQTGHLRIYTCQKNSKFSLFADLHMPFADLHMPMAGLTKIPKYAGQDMR